MRAYTDLEQSKKLAKILQPESADMWWGWCSDPFDEVNGGEYTIEPLLHKPVCNPEKTVPCWSLAALLSLMPKLYDEDDLNDAGCQPVLCKGYDNDLWHIVYRETIYGTDWYCELIDAAFEMVCWLKKNGKI